MAKTARKTSKQLQQTACKQLEAAANNFSAARFTENGVPTDDNEMLHDVAMLLLSMRGCMSWGENYRLALRDNFTAFAKHFEPKPETAEAR